MGNSICKKRNHARLRPTGSIRQQITERIRVFDWRQRMRNHYDPTGFQPILQGGQQ